MTHSSEEKRRATRYGIEVRVRIALSKAGGGNYCFGQANDISGSGMGVFAAIELALGDTINLELTLPYCRDKLLLRAVVRHRSGFRYGIEFLNLTTHQRKLLDDTCKALALVQ